MPITHSALMTINLVTGNPRIHMDGFKAFASFAGMILQVNLLAQVCQNIYLIPRPFNWDIASLNLRCVMIWLEVEVMAIVATLVSNGLFIGLRTCMRHKIQLD